MPLAQTAKALTITNPLVLYRSLVATHRIEPDASQLRLAAHLQNVYYRLKDYEPEVEYRDQLLQVSSALGPHQLSDGQHRPRPGKGLLASVWEGKEKQDSLALVQRMTDKEAAVAVKSPQGLLIHGEVGTGKSMLTDLLADALPNRRKKRWHFNAFMLQLYAHLEDARRRTRDRVTDPHGEHSLLRIARNLIYESPVVFLDEFQLPDRAASKILTNLFVPFFQLGGVLVATSNRMPEELSKASGAEFSFSSQASSGRLVDGLARPSSAQSQAEADFTAFLQILSARCEVWRLEGSKDWRRERQAPVSMQGGRSASDGTDASEQMTTPIKDNQSQGDVFPLYYVLRCQENGVLQADLEAPFQKALKQAARPYLAKATKTEELTQIPWTSSEVQVYGRAIRIPRAWNGLTMWSFEELCSGLFGPAEYISLASKFHTFFLTGLPYLTLSKRNEARRFIYLLDALYECKCKLLVEAAARPDDVFFPESRSSPGQGQGQITAIERSGDDQIHSETLSEVHQDLTQPFRPNISSYQPSASTPSYDSPMIPGQVLLTSSTRSVLADEDSDFGPLHSAERSRYQVSSTEASCDQQSNAERHGIEKSQDGSLPLDFRRTSAFIGQDELFAYKRAVSRLWEMCSSNWWERNNEGWWTPIRPELRAWERSSERATSSESAVDPIQTDSISPFRTTSEPPPKFSWVHAWGMMQWGKKFGKWGRGADGSSRGKSSRSE